jgi:hypothetical protein
MNGLGEGGGGARRAGPAGAPGGGRAAERPGGRAARMSMDHRRRCSPGREGGGGGGGGGGERKGKAAAEKAKSPRERSDSDLKRRRRAGGVTAWLPPVGWLGGSRVRGWNQSGGWVSRWVIDWEWATRGKIGVTTPLFPTPFFPLSFPLGRGACLHVTLSIHGHTYAAWIKRVGLGRSRSDLEDSRSIWKRLHPAISLSFPSTR